MAATLRDGDPGGHAVWLVRHGETEWARLGRHTGRTDVPLTETGRAQAIALGVRLAGHPFDLVLTSPLSRAADTAALAGFGDRAIVDPDLREWDYGAFEGRLTAEIRAEYPGWTIWRGPWPDGETIDQVAAGLPAFRGVRLALDQPLDGPHGGAACRRTTPCPRPGTWPASPCQSATM